MLITKFIRQTKLAYLKVERRLTGSHSYRPAFFYSMNDKGNTNNADRLTQATKVFLCLDYQEEMTYLLLVSFEK
jgi:hypothetical protein